MGQMHFSVPASALDFFEASLWQDAYLCGIEGVPWESHNRFADGRLTLTRGVDASAKLLVTCPVPTIGMRVLTTCSLRCQEQPHRFIQELARGSCFRVRVQSDTWQRGGLSLSDRFNQLLDEGTLLFLETIQRSLVDEDDPLATQAAIDAITKLEQSATELGNLFSAQSIAFRKSRENRLSTMLAVGMLPPSPSASEEAHPADADQLGTDDSANPMTHLVGRSFNAAAVRISWGDIETDSGKPDYDPVTQSLDACLGAGLRVIGGPLVDYQTGLLPDWLTLLEGDFDKLVSTMNQFVEGTVNQFRSRVNLWNAATSLNTAGPLGLDDEQIMRLSVGVLQTVRRCDPNTPVIMSLDQPCGEYLAKDQNGISPLHFADALLRSGLGLAGIGLNFRFGYDGGSTHPRSAIEFAQLIDRWATLGMPLLVQLSVAGSPGNDSRSRLPYRPMSLDPSLNGDPSTWAQFQCEFAKPLVETLLAKQIVHAIVWEDWSDASPHLCAHAGLHDIQGQPRPMLGYLRKVRDEMLM
ncbi:MAG: glycoside hydrolase family 10 [Planctomycetota bacterium]